MGDPYAQFARRLDVLGEKRAKLSHGYVTTIRNDGLVVVRPQRARLQFPLTGIIMTLVCFFVLKAFILASVGPVTYAERLGKLENGTVVERIGARAMAIDPLTQRLAYMGRPVLR